MERVELAVMAALLASLAVFLFAKTFVLFAVVLACAAGVALISVLRGVRA